MPKLLKNVSILVVLVTLVYFGNKEVQTYLGKQAVDDLPFAMHSLKDAKARAAQEGKLVLADYSAIWCPSCRKLDTQVFTSGEVATSISENFVYTRLDYDSVEGAAFAKEHNLVGFPRVLVLDINGARLAEMPLTFDPAEYSSNLKRVSATYLP